MGHAPGVGLGVFRGQRLNAARPTLMSSPPKPVDQIQPNLVCNVNNFLAPPPGPWGGVKKLNTIYFQFLSQF